MISGDERPGMEESSGVVERMRRVCVEGGMEWRRDAGREGKARSRVEIDGEEVRRRLIW